MANSVWVNLNQPGANFVGNVFQLGGTTSSFPMWSFSGNRIRARLADDSNWTSVDVGTLTTNAGGIALNGVNDSFFINNIILFKFVAPTISSGFGSTPSVANNNGTAAFIVNVGTGGTATAGVIGLPAASNGWILICNDITAAAGNTGLRTVQTASTTASATIQSQNSAGTATAWATGSLVRIIAMAY